MYIDIYAIMKTMCPPGYHDNGFVATHAPGHMMYGYHFINCTSCAQVYKLPQSHFGDNLEGTLFSRLHIYYAHLVSLRFEHCVCRGSLITTYIERHMYIFSTHYQFFYQFTVQISVSQYKLYFWKDTCSWDISKIFSRLIKF